MKIHTRFMRNVPFALGLSRHCGSRTLAFAGIAVALVAAAPLANAHPGQPSPVFDPNEVGWAGLRDRTVVEFDADLQVWADRGFLPIDLEADTFG